jgi:hypothetical protein
MPDAAVTRAPAGDGKTLVRGRGVQGLCPPGWSGKEDDQWHGLRFTSADGKEYIMAQNSWGTDNPYKGTWYFTKAFVAMKTIDIMVHKDALPKEIAKKLGIATK